MINPRIIIVLIGLLAAGCASKAPVAEEPADRVLDQLNASGWTAFESGEYVLSASMFERALDRAYVRDDRAAASDAAYNAAAAHARARQFPEAIELLATARREAPAGSEARLDAIDRLTVALLLETEQYDRSGEYLTTAMERAAQRPITLRALTVSRADLAIRTEDRTAADGIIASLGSPDPGSATEQMAFGRYAALVGDHETAAERFVRAADLYRESTRYDAMARALASAAGSTESLGRRETAADLWERAARSARLQGLTEWADAWDARAKALEAGR